MKTTLTKSEKKYIVAMFKEDSPAIKGISDIRQLPAGWIGLFMDNVQAGEVEADLDITNKFLEFHNLPKETTYTSLFSSRKGKVLLDMVTKKQAEYGVVNSDDFKIVPVSKLPSPSKLVGEYRVVSNKHPSLIKL